DRERTLAARLGGARGGLSGTLLDVTAESVSQNLRPPSTSRLLFLFSPPQQGGRLAFGGSVFVGLDLLRLLLGIAGLLPLLVDGRHLILGGLLLRRLALFHFAGAFA